MRTVLCISYIFHDRALRARGILPRLPALGISPIVVTHRVDAVPSSLQRSSCVIAPEPGYAWMRAWGRLLTGRRAGAADSAARAGAEASHGPGGEAGSVRSTAPTLPRHREWEWRLLFPDRNLLWIVPACIAGVRAGRRHAVEAVYASAWPVSALFAGWLAARILRRPFVAELRDLWVDNPFLPPRPAARLRLERAWERRLLEAARRVIVVTEPMKRQLLAAHPGLRPDDVAVISNGFDSTRARAPVVQGREATGGSVKLLLYTGALYGRRDPSRLLEALRRLNDPVTRVRLRLVGEINPEFEPLLMKARDEGWCETAGSVSYDASLAEMARADALLLLIEGGPGSAGIMTGKLFDYLASGRPVVAVAPADGVAAALVREAEAGAVVDPADDEGLETVLRALADGRLTTPDPARAAHVLEPYAWSRLSEQVARLLLEVMDGRSSRQTGRTGVSPEGRP